MGGLRRLVQGERPSWSWSRDLELTWPDLAAPQHLLHFQ